MKIERIEELAPRPVQGLAREVARCGGRLWIVGGWVRDHLLGREPRDCDLVCFGLEGDRLDELLGARGKLQRVGRAFPIRKWLRAGVAHDVQLASGSLDEDAAERDLTLNALYADPLTGELADPTGGAADLRARLLRAVGPSFAADPVRKLRLVRAALVLGAEPTPETWEVARNLRLDTVSRERIFEELRAVLGSEVDLGPLPRLWARVALAEDWPELVELRTEEGSTLLGDLLQRVVGCMSRGEDRFTALLVAIAAGARSRGALTDSDAEPASRRWLARVVDPRSAESAQRRLDLLASALETVSRAGSVNSLSPELGRLLVRASRVERGLALWVLLLEARPRPDSASGQLLEAIRSLSLQGTPPEPWIRGEDLVAAGWRPGPNFGDLLEALYLRQLQGEFATREAALQAIPHPSRIRGSSRVNPRPRARNCVRRCVPFGLLFLVAACAERSEDRVDRLARWERASEIRLHHEGAPDGDAVRVARQLGALLRKPVVPDASEVVEDDAPRAMWIRRPVSAVVVGFDCRDERFAQILRVLEESSEADPIVFWAWSPAEVGEGPRFLLAAKRPEDVPFDLLAPHRTGDAGFQVLRGGELWVQGRLERGPRGWFPPGLELLSGDAPATPPARLSVPGFRVACAVPLPESELASLRFRLRLLGSLPHPAGVDARRVDIVLHDDPEEMRRIAGGWDRCRVNRVAARVHWLRASAEDLLPDARLLLELRWPPGLENSGRVAAWWREGHAFLLGGLLDRSPWYAAFELLARDPRRPSALELLQDASYERLEPWRRRPLAALLFLLSSRFSLSAEQASRVLLEVPGAAWAMDRALELELSGFALRAAQLRSPPRAARAFGRTLAIEPSFDAGYFDPGFDRALEHARAVGADSVLLLQRLDPEGSGAASRPVDPERATRAVEWASARARAAGLEVRLRLRWTSIRSGQIVGGLWKEDPGFWRHELAGMRPRLQAAAFAARLRGDRSLSIGLDFHGVLRPLPARGEPRLVGPLSDLLRDLREAFGGPVAFEFKTQGRLESAAFLTERDGVVLGTRHAFERAVDRAEPNALSRPIAAGRALSQAVQRAVTVALRGLRDDRVHELELDVRLHAHASVAKYPERPWPGVDPIARTRYLDAVLRGAWVHPGVSGVILEDGAVPSGRWGGAGLADAECSAVVTRWFRRPTVREALFWFLPAAVR